VILPEICINVWVEDYEMLRKRHREEEIVTKLRQVDVLITRGHPVDRGNGSYVFPLAVGIQRPERRSGEAAEIA